MSIPGIIFLLLSVVLLAMGVYGGTVVVPEAADAVEFLAAHPGNLTLQRTRAALLYGWQPEVPRLLTTEGGLRLAG